MIYRRIKTVIFCSKGVYKKTASGNETLTNSTETSQIIKSQTKEFKAIKSWSIFSEFYALELMLNPELKGKINDWNTVGTKRDRGTHHDHLILGELAYCEIIVSDDKNLKRRWDKLYAKRLIPFTMISSSELLDSFNYE